MSNRIHLGLPDDILFVPLSVVCRNTSLHICAFSCLFITALQDRFSVLHRLVRFASSLLFSLVRCLCSTKTRCFHSRFLFQYSPLFIPTNNDAIFCLSKFYTRVYKAETYQKEKLHFSLQQKKFFNQQYLSTELLAELCVANCRLYELQNEHNDNGKQMKKEKKEMKTSIKNRWPCAHRSLYQYQCINIYLVQWLWPIHATRMDTRADYVCSDTSTQDDSVSYCLARITERTKHKNYFSLMNVPYARISFFHRMWNVLPLVFYALHYFSL